MANRKITLKRNNSGTVEPLYPTTTADQIFTNDGLTPIFSSNKISYAALPDGVKYGLKFQGTVGLSSTAVSVDTLTAFSSLIQDKIGSYVIVSAAGKLTGKFISASGLIGNVTYKVFGEEGEYETGSDSTTEVINLEKGDWIIFTNIEEDTSEPVNVVYSFSIINNTYREAVAGANAGASTPGIISAADIYKLSTIASGADNYGGFNVTDGSNSTNIVSGGTVTFAAGGDASVSNSNGTITFTATDTVYTHPDYSYTPSAGIETNLSDITLLDSLTVNGTGHTTASTYRKLVAGTNVTITAAADGNITIASTDTNTVYTHPTYTTRSIDTDGVVVIDTFTSDEIGSVTGITTRTLPNASTSAAGVMSAADKTKLDATNVVQYAAAATTEATYGFIFFDED